MERIHEEIRCKLSQNKGRVSVAKPRDDVDVSNVTCPKELLDILDSSKDPETIEVMHYYYEISNR